MSVRLSTHHPPVQVLLLNQRSGFYPDFTDTSRQGHNTRGGVSWENEEDIQRSSSVKPCRWSAFDP
jgi:hypothetical protein